MENVYKGKTWAIFKRSDPLCLSPFILFLSDQRQSLMYISGVHTCMSIKIVT